MEWGLSETGGKFMQKTVHCGGLAAQAAAILCMLFVTSCILKDSVSQAKHPTITHKLSCLTFEGGCALYGEDVFFGHWFLVSHQYSHE